MARTTISLPDELKEQMDAVEGENWSAIAAEAFRKRLAELEWLKRATKMTKESIVKRMQSAKDEEGKENYLEGQAAGRQWAAKDATPKQLKRLAAYVEDCDRNSVAWWDSETPMWNAPFSAPDYLFFEISPKDQGDRHAPGEFWEHVLGDEAEERYDADFLKGFGEGALAVWDEVKDEL